MTKRVCRSSAVMVFTVVAWLLTLFVLTNSGWAQGKKITGTGKFGPTLSQTLLLPTDVPKHEVMLTNRVQTWNSTDPEWNNVEVTQFVFTDYIAGSGYHRGHNTNLHPGGDRTFISYEGQTMRTTNADGSWASKFEGTFRFTGGTGKFQGISGQGTYIGKASAPGGSTPTAASFDWQGEYSLAK
jgi:hypothetical protein